ncbi:MAG: hypothetical protein AAB474_01175 [Patescibacteria group bacterium]
MANEVKNWKKPGCSVNFYIDQLSQRETFSREINEKYGEGGGLNADYRTVEAVAIAANTLGSNGLKYGEDFIFKTKGPSEISFDFADGLSMQKAKRILKDTIV